jgi:hypothetical protein
MHPSLVRLLPPRSQFAHRKLRIKLSLRRARPTTGVLAVSLRTSPSATALTKALASNQSNSFMRNPQVMPISVVANITRQRVALIVMDHTRI